MSEPVVTTGVVAVPVGGANITNGKCSLSRLFLVNTSGSTIWVQIFDLPVASVTIGTTNPMWTIPVTPPTVIGHVDIEWAMGLGWLISNRLSLFATTTALGSTDPGAGILAQAWIN